MLNGLHLYKATYLALKAHYTALLTHIQNIKSFMP